MAGTMTRLLIRDFTRILLSEPSASRWSDTELNNLIDYGQEDFCFQTQCLEDIDTQAIVANQEKYDLPSDYIAVKHIEVRRGSTIYEISPRDLQEFYESTTPTTGVPERYNIYQEDLFLHPRYSTADQTTTLNASLTATATSATITSNSGFSTIGRVIINSEVIGYTGNTSTTLTGLSRGLEGTTAASHSSGDTITQRGLWIYFIKKPARLSSDSSTLEIPSQFDRAPAYYAGWHARLKTRDYDLAAGLQAQYGEWIEKGKIWIKKFWRDKVYQPK